MKKIVYVIPGYSETTKLIGYRYIIKAFKDRGFQTFPININRKYNTMSGYIHQFYNQYKGNTNNEIYLLGFSFGAFISFVVATQINPKHLILCSLSPFFSEDVPHLPNRWLNSIGKKRINDFNNYSFNNLVKKIYCNTKLIVGEKEAIQCINRTKDAHKKIGNSQLYNVCGKYYIENVV